MNFTNVVLYTFIPFIGICVCVGGICFSAFYFLNRNKKAKEIFFTFMSGIFVREENRHIEFS